MASTSEECTDHYDTKECKAWAKLGRCDINPNWMFSNCRKSCNKCNDQCTDPYDTEKCKKWAMLGECDINPNWMSLNCRKSCNKCSDRNKMDPSTIRHFLISQDVCSTPLKNGTTLTDSGYPCILQIYDSYKSYLLKNVYDDFLPLSCFCKECRQYLIFTTNSTTQPGENPCDALLSMPLSEWSVSSVFGNGHIKIVTANITVSNDEPNSIIRIVSQTDGMQLSLILSMVRLPYEIIRKGFDKVIDPKAIVFSALMATWTSIQVPENHSVMISFPQMWNMFENADNSKIESKIRQAMQNITRITYDPYDQFRFVALRPRNDRAFYLAYKLRFSFHKQSQVPELVQEKFNCSVNFYYSFRHHLDCNLVKECYNGEDETGNCPYSSPECPGGIASDRKCFYVTPVFPQKIKTDNRYHAMRKTSWPMAATACKRENRQLATIKSFSEGDALLQVNTYLPNYIHESQEMFFGLTLKLNDTYHMYRKMWQWVDGSPFYVNTANIEYKILRLNSLFYCGTFAIYYPYQLDLSTCESMVSDVIICEKNFKRLHVNNSLHVFPNLRPTNNNTEATLNGKPYSSCFKGHVTHSFLTCDLRSDCGVEGYINQCPVKAKDIRLETLSWKNEVVFKMFACQSDAITIQFTLVCDFRNDCKDRSDEMFCSHPLCSGFLCQNQQCVNKSEVCDGKVHCLDESDEGKSCKYTISMDNLYLYIVNTSIITFDGEGSFYETNLDQPGICPDTHYKCIAEFDYCLPVYTRCNGVKDCTSDEDNCDNVSCPGYYKCLDSSICVHVDNLCDGWPQCPQHDDEWMCGEMACPSQCVCQGQAFVCQGNFQLEYYPGLRFLHIKNTPLSLNKLNFSPYLIYLSLNNCSVFNLNDISLINLQVFDLSDNKLSTVNMAFFLKLKNLKDLRLAGNPLTLLTNNESSNIMTVLERIDLSGTNLQTFDSMFFSQKSRLQILNLSFSDLSILNKRSFEHLSHLQVIDLKGCPLKQYSVDMFKGLSKLQFIFSVDARLCCEQLHVAKVKCIAQEETIFSTCDHLVRTKYHQVALLICGVFGVLINILDVVYQYLCNKESCHDGRSVLWFNLNVSNIVTGAYCVIISIADVVYSGNYILYEQVWTHSVTCTVAGVLFIVSTHVSALTVAALSMSCLLQQYFRQTHSLIKQRPAILVCFVAWALCLSLAVYPLLPFASHWKFYEQSSVCTPLIVSAIKDYGNYHYSLGSISIFFISLCLCIFTFAFVAFVLLKRHNAKLTSSLNTKKMHFIHKVCALNFLFVVLYSFFSMQDDIRINEDLKAAVVYFCLPLPAVLNPVIHISALFQESKRHKTMLKLSGRLR